MIKESDDSKTARAYRFIKERIEDGTYTSGYRLVLDTIAHQIGTSAVPVREAIRLLEAEQLVTLERNVGAQVAFMHEREYIHTMETLALVEGAATALSAAHLDSARIARARLINEEMKEAVDAVDPSRLTRLNRSFHAELFDVCPNPHVLDLVHRGWKRLALLRESVFGFVPGRAQQSVKEHEDLLAMLESGASGLEIELAAREHRIRTLEAVVAHRAQSHPGHYVTGVPRCPKENSHGR